MKPKIIPGNKWEIEKLFTEERPYKLLKNIEKYEHSKNTYDDYVKSVENLRIILDTSDDFREIDIVHNEFLFAESNLLKEVIFKNNKEIDFDDLMLESFGHNNPSEELKFINSRKFSKKKYENYIISLFEVYRNASEIDDYIIGNWRCNSVVKEYKIARLELYENIAIKNFDFSHDLLNKIISTFNDMILVYEDDSKNVKISLIPHIASKYLSISSLIHEYSNTNKKDLAPGELLEKQKNTSNKGKTLIK